MVAPFWERIGAAALGLLIGGCLAGPVKPIARSDSRWTSKALEAALTDSTRPAADRELDANRKPAELVTFLGVERGMVTLDSLVGQGYLTEVLSIAVGSTGKVYAGGPSAQRLVEDRAASGRLRNIVAIGANHTLVPPNSIDFVLISLNLHDIYNAAGPQATETWLRSLHKLMKGGSVLGVVDHVGMPDADNSKLHRMQKQQAIDVVTSAGFILETQSSMFARESDDHSKRVDDPSVRWKTDQFVLKFRKPR